MNTGGYGNALARPGQTVNPGYWGHSAASQGLGQTAQRQAAKPTHVRVPLATLMSLLLAEPIKPVVPPRPRQQTPQSFLPGLANRVLAPPPPSVGSLSQLFQSRRPQPTPRTGLNRRPSLGRYQNF